MIGLAPSCASSTDCAGPDQPRPVYAIGHWGRTLYASAAKLSRTGGPGTATVYSTAGVRRRNPIRKRPPRDHINGRPQTPPRKPLTAPLTRLRRSSDPLPHGRMEPADRAAARPRTPAFQAPIRPLKLASIEPCNTSCVTMSPTRQPLERTDAHAPPISRRRRRQAPPHHGPHRLPRHGATRGARGALPAPAPRRPRHTRRDHPHRYRLPLAGGPAPDGNPPRRLGQPSYANATRSAPAELRSRRSAAAWSQNHPTIWDPR